MIGLEIFGSSFFVNRKICYTFWHRTIGIFKFLIPKFQRFVRWKKSKCLCLPSLSLALQTSWLFSAWCCDLSFVDVDFWEIDWKKRIITYGLDENRSIFAWTWKKLSRFFCMLLLQVCWERQLFKKDSAKSEKYLKEIKGKNGMITVWDKYFVVVGARG